ncbi:hypothetical protein AMTRI_Chr01g136580 [Amborella trichopoda]
MCGLATLFSSVMTFPRVREEFSQFPNILVIVPCLDKPKGNARASTVNSSSHEEETFRWSGFRNGENNHGTMLEGARRVPQCL